MSEQLSRTELLLGNEAIEKLRGSHVAIFGIGGVGGYVTEALARSGVGSLTLIDNDTVSLSNLNRQIIALRSTLGKYKVDVAKERINDIDPEIKVTTHKLFYLPDTSSQIDLSAFDYVVDAIDTVTGKLEIIMQAIKAGTPVISSMGTGNKIHPSMLEVADISKTSVCPLAKVMRRELKKRGVYHLKVVYSKEKPIKPAVPSAPADRNARPKATPGSCSFVPSAAGLLIAGEVVRELTNIK